jgi:glycosyltransferase involved in cell wall biosynthesis
MSTPRKVVYLSGAPRVSTKPQAAIGGARTRVLGIIQGFSQAGFVVETFIAGDHARDFVLRSDFDAKVKKNVFIRILSDLVRLAYACKNGIAVWMRFKRCPYAYEMLGLMQFLGFFLKMSGTCWILETHALLYKESFFARKATFFWRLARFIEKKCYQKADWIVTVTEETKNEVAEFSGVRRDKIVVVPNAVDRDLFHDGAHDGRRFFSQPTIGFVGVMYEWQGLDMLLRAVHELKRENTIFKVVLVGDGPEHDRLQELAAELGLRNDVVFTGRIPPASVPRHIAGMDLCYSGQVSGTGGETSRSPIKTYEYLAMKKPVLSSDFEDARMIIRNGVNGYLFGSGVRGNLPDVLRIAFREREAWPAMGENGHRAVMAGHTWDARVKRLLEGLGEKWS